MSNDMAGGNVNILCGKLDCVLSVSDRAHKILCTNSTRPYAFQSSHI